MCALFSVGILLTLRNECVERLRTLPMPCLLGGMFVHILFLPPAASTAGTSRNDVKLGRLGASLVDGGQAA
jgi:hypothetical protein